MDEVFSSMAETNVIGWLLIDPDAVLPKVRSILSSGDFLHTESKALFAAACELSDNGQHMDVVTIHARAVRNGVDISNDWIRNTMGSVPDKSHIEESAIIVHDEAIARAAAAVGNDLAFRKIGPEEAVSKLQDVVAGRCSTLPTPMEQMQEYFTHCFDAEHRTRIPTGFPALDRMIGGGLPLAEVTTIASRPSVGKTNVGVSVGTNVARAGGRVLYFSLEMSRDQINNRRLAAVTGFTTDYIENKRHLGNEEASRIIANGISALSKEQFIICDENCKLSDIERHARAELPLDLIVVDHMGIITPDKETDSLYISATMRSHALKRLAKATGVPVLMLCQLNRQVEQRENKRPHLHDLRESGAIEEDSNLVLLLYRDGYYQTEKPGQYDVEPLEINIAKNRGGQTGVVTLDYIAGCCRITDPSSVIQQTNERTPFDGEEV